MGQLYEKLVGLNLLITLGKEEDLVSVFTFCFHLIGERCAKIFQSFTVFPAVEQNFIHNNEQFSCPISIELATKILVSVESYIVLENGFEEVEKCTLTSISFLRNHQKNGELLHGLEIEQLQIIHTQLVLFPEDVPYKGFNVRKLSLF